MNRLSSVPIKFGAFLSRGFCRTFHVGRKLNVHVSDPQEPFSVIPGKFPKWASNGEEAFYFLKDGANVFIHGGAATPSLLIQELYDYVMTKNLKDIKLFHIHTEGVYPFNDVAAQGHFRSISLFIASNCRAAVQEGRADYTPIFLSDVPLLFRRKHIQLDLAIINVTPPDKHGFCSLGPSVDVTRSAIQNAKHIVAQVNDQLPLTRGDASIHFSNLTVLRTGSQPCHQMAPRKSSDVEDKIGSIIAENLVEDGATLQTGIGAIPDAVLGKLTNHRHLGVHTEMFTDGIVPLVEVGAITNAYKKLRPGKIVSSFVVGTKKVFDFVDDNPLVDMCDVQWVNSPAVIAQNPKPVAINSCIEVDLTGQVSSDSIGKTIYSGFGGQVDFLRGAALSLDGEGKPIIALPSTTKRGESKIVPHLKLGGGVVTTRAHVHYVVTEFGIAYLFGRNLRQRAHALIQIAHPDHREFLEKASFEQLKVMPSPD
ncbi:Acetyl coenzyme A hydrolase transferase [Paragonimus heterotremus]|uniref:Acetyl coenzyme A hydrolase transferase n=1 Tax=Paragonimus heterotremus TaxID=100268 RepID=A0A8J4X1I1_9TREM|nr:Acetyl coenzyme A hydrolase transferase [Paragonimus heterotremus]